MRDTDPGRRAVARATAGEDQDPLLDELRTAVGRAPRALVAEIAAWPAPRACATAGPDEPADRGRAGTGPADAGQADAGQADAGMGFTPLPRTRR
ncbi:hypothetical protein ACFQ77_29730 [Streptomyces virginiae]|uniref:hypothetical protein n=1 Tax=Streptomyces virginiae TaxID=1961 RepID=UPI00369B327F